jgi:hydrogenase maturation protein HypF
MPLEARRVRVHGTVQGVGFRPFVYRLALAHDLRGWVLNGAAGVEAHLEGSPDALEAFLMALEQDIPPAAHIESLKVEAVPVEGFPTFTIRQSQRQEKPTVRVSPELAVCEDCLHELFNPDDRRFGYPFINCTNCGPRYSIILGLPYDRERTTMRDWPMCPNCEREYRDPTNRRFHAQPTACPVCGPHLRLAIQELQVEEPAGSSRVVRGDDAAIRESVRLLQGGHILAVKGIGGYHLVCDARNEGAVQALRERKFRKEKPFALMARDLETVHELVELTPESVSLLTSSARPIVLAPARISLPGVAPDHTELGVMLPYTPLHHLLFWRGAPDVLVMTSANRSNEPIAYLDEDALERLSGIADAFLIGERPIARRVDDSVMRVSHAFGSMMLRRSRGFSPGVVAHLPARQPILAVGSDLKNTIAIVVDGQVIVSQHLGDLEDHATLTAFAETVHDLCAMHDIRPEACLVAHDAHPGYHSTAFALEWPAQARVAVQHHRAHIASVLAERTLAEQTLTDQHALEARVLGVALDGTGFGDDNTIWGGEFFVGSLHDGFERVAHLEYAHLPGGDAAARFPVQAAAGFLAKLETPDLTAPPFHFPQRYLTALELVRHELRVYPTSSVGRLFDTVAALCGFTREITFEGQAAIWLEQRSRRSITVPAYRFPFNGRTLEHATALEQIIHDRRRGRDVQEIALAFHTGLAAGVAQAALGICEQYALNTVVLSGGVMQNALLLRLLSDQLGTAGKTIWVNQRVPVNDGGISLGQAVLCAFQTKH